MTHRQRTFSLRVATVRLPAASTALTLTVRANRG